MERNEFKYFRNDFTTRDAKMGQTIYLCYVLRDFVFARQ